MFFASLVVDLTHARVRSLRPTKLAVAARGIVSPGRELRRTVVRGSTIERGADGVDAEEHRERLTMEQALAYAFKGNKAELLVEAHRIGLGVRNDPDAADERALLQGQDQDVPKQGNEPGKRAGTPIVLHPAFRAARSPL